MSPAISAEHPLASFRRALRLHGVETDMQLPNLEHTQRLLAALATKASAKEALAELAALKQGHQDYLSGAINPARLCGLEELRAPGTSAPAPVGSVILSSGEHFHAEVVVARCMDNRCSCPNVELNKRPSQVCEVVSAGHVLEPKDLESLAVGVALKGAKVILVEAHGGTCGAIQLTLAEKGQARLQHAVTHDIAAGLQELQGADSPHVFVGTLQNLDSQLGKILDPELNVGLLEKHTGSSSFLELVRLGQCVLIGAFVDFEVIDSGDGRKSLIKRLSFFDTVESLTFFLAEKLRLYNLLLKKQ